MDNTPYNSDKNKFSTSENNSIINLNKAQYIEPDYKFVKKDNFIKYKCYKIAIFALIVSIITFIYITYKSLANNISTISIPKKIIVDLSLLVGITLGFPAIFYIIYYKIKTYI